MTSSSCGVSGAASSATRQRRLLAGAHDADAARCRRSPWWQSGSRRRWGPRPRCPSMAMIRSLVLSPARAAGLAGVTLATSAPAGRLRPRLSAISGVTACSLAPEPRPLDRGAAALRRGDHHLHHVGGNGEADALRAARAREDRGVDADEPPAEIDQRAARIAGIDGGVGLDEELVVGDADLGARHRRDDAVGDGLADREGIADGEHHVADLQAHRNRRIRAPESARSAP